MPLWAWIVAGVVLFVAVWAAALIAPGGTPAAQPSSSPTPNLTADQIVQQLGAQGAVKLLSCKVDAPSPPTLTQERCQTPYDNELVVMVFADSAGAGQGLARLRGVLEAGHLPGAVIQGPYWLVNVGAGSTAGQRADVQKVLGGTLVSIGG